jgi:zinc transporter 9
MIASLAAVVRHAAPKNKMSKSVTLSIATNSLITASKGFGWWVTGSPTMFAETIHSAADVTNQFLLKVGEVRAAGAPDALHPFGCGQERFFWALVSAVSVFFIGCGVSVYHGVDSLLHPEHIEPFTLLPFALLLFALALELFTFITAWREIGGMKGLKENRSNTTVLAVLLEDAVALLGIALTLIVGGLSLAFGAMPMLDSGISIAVGLILGAMAIFLANVNRRMLIDVADVGLNHELAETLKSKGVESEVSSLIVDVDRFVVFVRVAEASVPTVRALSWELGGWLKQFAKSKLDKTIDAVYWKFPSAGG